MSQTDNQVFRERALKDKAAILELRQNTAFQGYFMRRVKQNIDRLTKSLKYDPLSKDDRETVRQQLLLYEELEKWTSDTEVISCESTINAQ